MENSTTIDEIRAIDAIIEECREVISAKFLNMCEHETQVTLTFLTQLIGKKAKAEYLLKTY
jgi:hypothetical protein